MVEQDKTNITKETDADLVKRARFDVEAFGPIYERYYEPIFKFVRSKIGNFHDCEDVTERIFTSVYRRIYRPNLPNPQYTEIEFVMRNESSLKQYIYRSAVNRIANYYRDNNSSGFSSLSVDELTDAQLWNLNYIDPQIEAEKKETGETVRKALWKLNEEDRRVIQLRVYDGLHFSEVGQALSIPENSAKTQLHRAMKRFGKAYLALPEHQESAI